MGRLLNGSAWATILRTDAAAATNVSRRVIVFSAISAIGIALLAIVSVTTPLGLSEAINSGSLTNVEFEYAPDLQPMGRGTLSRAEYVACRLCDTNSDLNCPGQAHGFTTFANASGSYAIGNSTAYISSTIPSNLTEIFGSGSTGDRNTVAGLFDIQYRSYIRMADQNSTLNLTFNPNTDQGRLRTVGTFQMYQSLVLDDRYDIVEGLVVNTAGNTPGIGFRNHTIPTTPGDGAQWTEGLLWIQPETVCVSSNLSLEFDIPHSDSVDQSVYLRDDGGFSLLQSNYPVVDLSDAQSQPELEARAHQGAVLNNFNLLKYFNATRNSAKLGERYQILTSLPTSLVPNQVFLQQYCNYGPCIPGIGYLDDPLSANITFVNQSRYIDVGTITQGFVSEDNANISFIASATGFLLGAASRIDNPEGVSRLDPGTKWTAPIHSCASTLKAFVMDVAFAMNGSASLSNLYVESATPRTYETNATTPLWAIENTGMNIGDVAPYWGLVDDRYETSPNLWTMRKPSVYLPAGAGSEVGLVTDDASAGAFGPASVLQAVYVDALNFGLGPTSDGLPDYTGKTNFPIFLRWQSLSRQAGTASTIINLIWTDIAANYLIGAKSNPGSGVSGPSGNVQTLISGVRLFNRVTTYDLRYAIPAFIFLAVYIAILGFALILRVLNRAKLGYMKDLLNQTAAGRAVTIERHGLEVATYSTKRWIKRYGHEIIEFDLGYGPGPESRTKATADGEKGDGLPLNAGTHRHLQEVGRNKAHDGLAGNAPRDGADESVQHINP
jgi:hypothetical protein